jgi:diacylglycerol kinase
MLRFLRNVNFALQGIRSFFKTESNGRIMRVIAILTIAAGVLLRITSLEWMIILGCIALIISLEMVNSSIEKVCNFITTDYKPEIKQIKDIAAGAVLFASILVAIIGSIVFIPYIINLL